MLNSMNTTNDKHANPVVLLVEPNERDRELYGAWLEDAGITAINCPGPKVPGFGCLGTCGRPCPLAEVADLAVLDTLRTSWVAAYRQKHAEADWWAESFGAVEHSLETQERVFRMAEQLVGRGIDRLAVFAALRQADGVAQSSTGTFHEGALQTRHLYLQGRALRSDDYRRDPWSSSLPAAAAGCGVIDTLLSAHGIVVNLLPPDAFEEQLGRAGQRWLPQPQEGRAIILLDETL